MSDAILALKAEFDQLTAEHNAIIAQVEALRADREGHNLAAIAAQEQAAAVSAQMQAIYEENGFFELAKRRGRLADAIMSLKSQD